MARPPFRSQNRDGQVAVPDLLTLLAAWGLCP